MQHNVCIVLVFILLIICILAQTQQQYTLNIRLGALYNRPNVKRSIELGIQFLQMNKIHYNSRLRITTNFTVDFGFLSTNDAQQTVAMAQEMANKNDTLGA